MDLHFPFEEFVPYVGKLLYFEGHAGGEHTKEKYMKMLKPYFKRVVPLGEVTDYGEPRLLFKATR